MMRAAALAMLVVSISAHGATFHNASLSTTNNADSCDVAVLPAATLLLPYFEVDFVSPAATARTTLFSVFNATNRPQIARVTVWTDLAFPVLTFNVFLTGYDVQSINLYDVLARGVIAPNSGTSNLTPPGARSLYNGANPGFLPNAATTCNTLPGTIPPSLLSDLKSGLTTGTYSTCGTTRVGLTHTNAIGYVTVDVVANCSPSLPTDPSYFASEVLFDNVLGGDYVQVNPNPTTGNYAGGNPLVHLRAVGANLPYTFYDRYTPASDRKRDRRQPLPSTFAARYIQGGTGAFNTDLRIWREGVVGGAASCSAYTSNNGTGMKVLDEVRFDEHENLTILLSGGLGGPSSQTFAYLPALSLRATSSSIFPVMASAAGDVGGWLYLNLASSNSPVRPRQNWVEVSMSAEGRYSVDFDALTLGNGCTPPAAVTNSQTPIGPGGNITP